MIEFETGRKVKPKITLAPLIDVVLQLLIFFMLSSYFISQPGIKITLPFASTAHAQEEKIIIYVSNEGEVFINEDKVSIPDLKSKIEQRLKDRKERSIILKADEKIDLGLAVKVMDIAREADVEGLVISTRTRGDQEK